MGTKQHRFAALKPTGARVLRDDHPAVVAGRPFFTVSALEHKRGTARILVSGHNSRKIGKSVAKGEWKGSPIFTLTLEERATCPRSCEMWKSCYGNRMHWSIRYAAGEETERRIAEELAQLQWDNPKGFVVRLHVLGDFYSVEYVDKWEGWLHQFPALRVFGYTARRLDDPIGQAVAALAKAHWRRFAIRTSGDHLDLPAAIVGRPEAGIICPAETGASECCGTCTLCWSAPEKTIVFLEH